MIRSILLASTALLAGCAAASADDAPPATSTAVTTPEAAPVAPAAAENSAELAAFFEAYDKATLELSPLGKAFRGIVDSSYGEWGDFSEAAGDRQQQLLQSNAEALRTRFDRASLSPADQLSYDLFLNTARRSADAYRFRDNGYVFDQMNGAQSQLPAFLINIHRVIDLATAEAYVSRLRNVDTAIDQALATSRRRSQAGVMPPRWVYPYVINDARNVLAGAPFDSSGKDSALFEDLKKKVGAATSISAADKARLIEEGRKALLQDVRPAYQRLIAEMERQHKIAPTDEGVWRFKNGSDYYAERLGFYTTTDMDPDQIH
ncbi:MAG TPA: DUF885 family protein, partial [Allosphingosinicella sp.]